MNVAKHLFGICVLAALAGCSFYSGYGVDALTAGQDSTAARLQRAIIKTSPDDKDHLVDAACFNIPVMDTTGNDAAKTDAAGADTAKVDTTSTKLNPLNRCQQQRNVAIAMLLSASDDMCQDHLRAIYGKDAVFNITSGTIAALASGWGTFINGAVAKSKLSAVAAFSNSERSLVNETVYKNMIVTAVTRKIRESRDEKVTAMIPGNFSKDMDAYPMMLAMHDVISYHYTCSFMFGLEKALEEGSQPGSDAKKAKLELERQKLEVYMDNRKQMLTAAKRADEIGQDPGLTGAQNRIKAIDEQLLTLSGGGTQNAGQQPKPVPNKPVPDKPAAASPATGAPATAAPTE